MTVELPVVPVGKNTITLPPLQSLQNLHSVSCNREAGFTNYFEAKSITSVNSENCSKISNFTLNENFLELSLGITFPGELLGEAAKKDPREEGDSTEADHDSLGSGNHEVIPVIAHRSKDRKSPFESVITILSIPSNNKKVTKSNNKARGSINTEKFFF